MFQRNRKRNRAKWLATFVTAFCLGACSPNNDQTPGDEAPPAPEATSAPETSPASEAAAAPETPPAPEMPTDWKVVTDSSATPEQVNQIGEKLGADLVAIRNTTYQVNGKRVQLNLMVVADAASAETVMAKMLLMKGEEALVRKDLIIYEFVGKNDVLPEIAEGRRRLDPNSPNSDIATGGETPISPETLPPPEMPADWKVTSDFQVPAEQVKAMSAKLGVVASSIRNTVYQVNGKRVQLNVIVTADTASAEALMAKLLPSKPSEFLLRKGLILYEFVGKDNVRSEIAKGRSHLQSK